MLNYFTVVTDKKMCKKCRMVKHIDDFQLYVRQNELDICKTCNMLKKVQTNAFIDYPVCLDYL